MKRGFTRGLCVAMWVLGALTSVANAQMVIIPRERVEEAANPTTIANAPMLFENDGVVSFGTISEDCGEWRSVLLWHTKGDTALTITQIKTSCGCLTAHWDKRSATNANGGEIEITYRPKGHAGEVEQRLFVYTTLSTSHPTAIVKVVGTVEPTTNRANHYPFMAGTLGLRTKSVVLSEREGQIEIAAMNCGSAPLRVKHDERLSLGDISAHTKPEVLQSGEEGVLCIDYSSEGEMIMLYLEGVNAAPRERKIEIEIEK